MSSLWKHWVVISFGFVKKIWSAGTIRLTTAFRKEQNYFFYAACTIYPIYLQAVCTVHTVVQHAGFTNTRVLQYSKDTASALRKNYAICNIVVLLLTGTVVVSIFTQSNLA
jgi:hypothetical protein